MVHGGKWIGSLINWLQLSKYITAYEQSDYGKTKKSSEGNLFTAFITGVHG
jgi:hypothetical protein